MNSYWIAVLVAAGIAALNGVLMLAWAKRHVRQTYARLYPTGSGVVDPDAAAVNHVMPARRPLTPA